MPNILHDLSVFLWGVRRSHPNWKETRVTFLAPIKVESRLPAYKADYLISFRKPALYILNAYEMEQDYNSRSDRTINAR